jgi:hypothetical protein
MSLRRHRLEESLCNTVKSKQKDGRQFAAADKAAGSRTERNKGAGMDQGVRSRKRLVETRRRNWEKLLVGTLGRVRRRDNGLAGEATEKVAVGMRGRMHRRDNGVATRGWRGCRTAGKRVAQG